LETGGLLLVKRLALYLNHRFCEHRKLGYFVELALLLMTKPFTLFLTGAWLLLAGLGSGCEPYSPHGSTEMGLVYDYIVRKEGLLGRFPYVVLARFHQYPEETDFSHFAYRSEQIGGSLDAAMRLTVRAECLATPNASAELQALCAQVNGSKTPADAILLAFSARCDGRDGRHYYYVERSGRENGKPTRNYEGNIYQVYKGRIEREIFVWIT
jgi:hypothetical protein